MYPLKLSNIQGIHTAGTNLTVADMLSQDFSTITNKMKQQVQHKTLPKHFEILQLKANNSEKTSHFT